MLGNCQAAEVLKCCRLWVSKTENRDTRLEAIVPQYHVDVDRVGIAKDHQLCLARVS